MRYEFLAEKLFQLLARRMGNFGGLHTEPNSEHTQRQYTEPTEHFLGAGQAC